MNLAYYAKKLEKGQRAPRNNAFDVTNTFSIIRFEDIPHDRQKEIFHSMVVCEI